MKNALLREIDDYFNNVSQEQFLKDLKSSGCLHLIEDIPTTEDKFVIKLDDGTYYRRTMTNSRTHEEHVEVHPSVKWARQFTSIEDKEFKNAIRLIGLGYTDSESYIIEKIKE